MPARAPVDPELPLDERTRQLLALWLLEDHVQAGARYAAWFAGLLQEWLEELEDLRAVQAARAEGHGPTVTWDDLKREVGLGEPPL